MIIFNTGIQQAAYGCAKRTATFMSRSTILCVIQHAPVHKPETRH